MTDDQSDAQLSLGKLLWLSVCEVRRVPQDRAELEWSAWEGDFMTKGEWQQAAERFLHSYATKEDA